MTNLSRGCILCDMCGGMHRKVAKFPFANVKKSKFGVGVLCSSTISRTGSSLDGLTFAKKCLNRSVNKANIVLADAPFCNCVLIFLR